MRLVSRLLLRALRSFTFSVVMLASVSSKAEEANDAIASPTDASIEPLVLQPASFEAAADEKAAQAAAKKKREDLQKAVATAYKPLFYDNNFQYINNPLYDEWFPGDRLKQMKVGDLATVDIGGQYRMRYHDEHNMRGFGLTGNDDTFMLYRTRLFANVRFSEGLRLYAEMLDAQSNYENFAPRIIEENRADLQNLFVDARVFENCNGALTFRGGRQELLYGSERLVSPLDWANTRRTFQGYKFFWVGEDWNIDGFYTRPLLVATRDFDSPTYSQSFYGTFATYKAIKNQTIDLYWLGFENDLAFNHFQYQTVGSRWLGAREQWLWEIEGGMQFGENTIPSDHWATFITAGVGRKNECHAWKPTLWCYYDFASGGAARGQGTGFNQLFPLGHKYLGFMDIFGRSNIESPNVQLTMQPSEKWKLLLWYYYLFLQDIRDTPYNIAMLPYNPGNAPASRDLGHEIDFLASYSINPRMDMLFGYSHFFAGQYFKQTPGIANRSDGDFFYTQFQWNF